MNILDEAYNLLTGEENTQYNFHLKYSRKFSGYNANVRKIGNNVEFRLSRKWREVSRDIKIGLLQELMCKLFKIRKKTTNTDLYSLFLKNIHIAVEKTMNDPILEESFNRVNEHYFYGLIDQPNLKWGSASFSKFGSYDYGTDTIVISTLLRDAEQEILDYVMYHELLHKKIKFRKNKSKTYHHTKEFKQAEKQFPDAEKIEKRLNSLSSRKRIKSWFFG